MSENNSETTLHKVGIEVVDSIFERMEKLHSPYLGAPKNIGQLFATCAAQEALAQYKITNKRGMLFSDQGGNPIKAWYVTIEDADLVMQRAGKEAQIAVAKLIQSYNPETEAVVIFTSYTELEPFRIVLTGEKVVSDKNVFTPGKYPLRPLPPKPKPVQLPKGIRTERKIMVNGVGYKIYHEKLGELGIYMVINYGAAHSEIRAEFYTGEKVREKERMEKFKEVVDIINGGMEQGLKVDLTGFEKTE
jgi:hypothetical protein